MHNDPTTLKDWDFGDDPEPVKPPVMTLRLEIASRILPTVIDAYRNAPRGSAHFDEFCAMTALGFADALIKAEGDRK